MHPVICEGLAVGCLRLRDLILVMRENKVLTACMDINLLTQVLFGHDRALNMPARTALAPWGLPVRLTILFRFPEDEIGRILLVLLAGYFEFTEARHHLIQVFMGQLSVALEGLGAEVNGTVCCHVSMALVDKGLDHLQHALNLLGCLRMGGSRFYVHVSHIFFALCDVALGNGVCIYPFLDGFLDDLVIHVGEVGNVINIVAFILKVAANRIKNDHRTRVSDMDEVVHSRAAYIHLYLSRL